jgi:hypothetical protein
MAGRLGRRFPALRLYAGGSAAAHRLAEPRWRPVSPPEAFMGLMDKVKAQATQLAQQTKEAAQAGQAKIDQAQASRRGDVMLRQLGAAVFAERTGRGTPDSQAKIDKLINDISAHERENGLNLAADPAQPNFPPQPTAPAAAPGTSFPEAAPTTNFPQAPPSTSFPEAAPNAGFHDAPPTFFPGAESPEPGPAEPEGGSGGFPPQS